MVKFAGKEYPDSLTVKQLVKWLGMDGGFVFSYNREPTAQEIINGC